MLAHLLASEQYNAACLDGQVGELLPHMRLNARQWLAALGILLAFVLLPLAAWAADPVAVTPAGLALVADINTEIHASGGAPDRVRQIAAQLPMQRAGTAEEVAEAIVWLLSDASSYTTGSVVEVTGGR